MPSRWLQYLTVTLGTNLLRRFGIEGGIGALAVLYKGENVVKVLRHYLGSDKCHTVYEAEGVGVAMGLHLLNGLNRKLTGAVAWERTVKHLCGR